MGTKNQWPSLPLEAWEDTFATLHRWAQIVGKIRLAQTPWINHSWHVPLYVTARGLTTSPVPHGARTFEITFDFLDHRLLIQTSDGEEEALPLRPQSVAAFYDELLRKLGELELGVSIHGSPNELEDATPFAEDRSHDAYDPAYATRCWRVLVQAARVLQAFRARFIGKCSPVHGIGQRWSVLMIHGQQSNPRLHPKNRSAALLRTAVSVSLSCSTARLAFRG